MVPASTWTLDPGPGATKRSAVLAELDELQYKILHLQDRVAKISRAQAVKVEAVRAISYRNAEILAVLQKPTVGKNALKGPQVCACVCLSVCRRLFCSHW